MSPAERLLGSHAEEELRALWEQPIVVAHRLAFNRVAERCGVKPDRVREAHRRWLTA